MTINITNEGVRYITPDENKYLTDGNGNYSDCVYLAANADPNNWYEVDEIPEEPDEPDEEIVDDSDYVSAAKILLGEEE